MTTDQTIRSTESSRASQPYQFRLTQPTTDTQFLDLLSSLPQPASAKKPAALLASNVDSNLNERDYGRRDPKVTSVEAEPSATRASKAAAEEESDSQSSQPIVCCFWNEIKPQSAQPAPVDTDPHPNAAKIAATLNEQGVKNQQITGAELEPNIDPDAQIESDRARVVKDVKLTTIEKSDIPKGTAEAEDAEAKVIQEKHSHTTTKVLDLPGDRKVTAKVATSSESSDEQSSETSKIDAGTETELEEKIQRWTEEQSNKTDTKLKSEASEQPKVAKTNSKSSDEAELNSAVNSALESGDEDTDQSAGQNKHDDRESAFGRSRKESVRNHKAENEQSDGSEYLAEKKANQAELTKRELAKQETAQVKSQQREVVTDLKNLEHPKTNRSASEIGVSSISSAGHQILKEANTKFSSPVSAGAIEGTASASAMTTVPTETQFGTNQDQTVKQAAKSTLQRLPPQTINRITSALKDAPNGDSTLRLRLNPVELGSVEIEIAFRGGVMSAKLKAENGQTQQLLQEGLDSLKTRLAEHGISIESLDVELGSESNSGNSQQEFPTGRDRQSSGFFEQKQQQRTPLENKLKSADESSSKDAETVGQWAVNVVA